MPKWKVLVEYLREHGPTTTGALGHVYGIGENIRGIRREANRNLAGRGYIRSDETFGPHGERLPWATYRLEEFPDEPVPPVAEKRIAYPQPSAPRLQLPLGGNP
jgi:hypothetical protein